MIRKMRRDRIRRLVGNKGLNSLWRGLQQEKYQMNYYFKVCDPYKQRRKIRPLSVIVGGENR